MCIRDRAIDAYAPGYINKDKETVVGLQTDAPLKRAIMPEGGIRTVSYTHLRPHKDNYRD